MIAVNVSAMNVRSGGGGGGGDAAWRAILGWRYVGRPSVGRTSSTRAVLVVKKIAIQQPNAYR